MPPLAQSICDREVTDQPALDKDALIKQLTDSITVAMEIDTEDTEVLKNRPADNTVALDHLEGIITGLRAEYATQTQ
eukprot:9405667-Heterocapsa_arctica.AAC.1